MNWCLCGDGLLSKNSGRSLLAVCSKKSESKKAPIGWEWGLIWAAISAIAAALSLIVSVVALVISVKTYNERYYTYYSDAASASEVQYTFKANGSTKGSSTVTLVAGEIEYGYSQTEGTGRSTYQISVRAENSTCYYVCKRFTSSTNSYSGSYYLTTSSTRMKYIVTTEKINNIDNQTTFVIDFIVD